MPAVSRAYVAHRPPLLLSGLPACPPAASPKSSRVHPVIVPGGRCLLGARLILAQRLVRRDAVGLLVGGGELAGAGKAPPVGHGGDGFAGGGGGQQVLAGAFPAGPAQGPRRGGAGVGGGRGLGPRGGGGGGGGGAGGPWRSPG